VTLRDVIKALELADSMMDDVYGVFGDGIEHYQLWDEVATVRTLATRMMARTGARVYT
jgi:hypothetical protein